MKRHAKRPEPKPDMLEYIGRAADTVGHKISENPAVAGGSVAFAVVMFFVSSNALFYQPFPHKDTLFATRSMDGYVAPVLPRPVSMKIAPQTGQSTQIASETTKAPTKSKDLQLMDVQAILAQLKFYDGTVDGVAGPKTRAAIASFQQQAGLEPTGEIDPLLIDAIRTASIPVENIPAPAKRSAEPQAVPEVEAVATSVSTEDLSETEIRKLQAGLKSFGNDGIDIDGKLGAKTMTAIKEFQKLFQMEKSKSPLRDTLRRLEEVGIVAG